MPDQRHRFIVLNNPLPGREAEYNDWYDKVHFTELLQVRGIVSAQRFELAGPENQFPREDEPSMFRCCAIYEFDEEPSAVFAAIDAAAEQGVLSRGDPPFDTSPGAVHAWVYSPVGDRRTE